MLKTKVLKCIIDELEISYGDPFLIEGEKYPYRIKKDGNIERFKGIWIESSYSYLDLIAIIDANRVKKITENIVEQSSIRKIKNK